MIYPNERLSGKVLHPVPSLGKEYLRMLVQDTGLLEYESAFGVVPYCHRHFPVRPNRGAELDDQ